MPTRSELEVLAWREQKLEYQVGVEPRFSGVCLVSSVLLTGPHLLIAEFSIWTREAGAGGLSIAVEGPSKAEIAFEDRKDGSSGVSYIVQEPGEMDAGRGKSSIFIYLGDRWVGF